VVGDLMDEAPSVIGTRELEDLPERVKQCAERQAWVERAAVRLREHGHLITGDVIVVARNEDHLVRKIEDLIADVHEIDWRLHAITVMPVSALDARL
jgi:hypothetical protein